MKNAMRVADSNFDRIQARNGLTAKNQSQLNKLIPILQIGAKKGPDDATIQMKMEARIAALKKLKASLDKVVVRLTNVRLAESEERVKMLSRARKSVEAIIEARPPVGVSRHLRACMNELVSLREASFIGASITKKEASLFACTSAIAHVEELINESKKKLQAHKQAVEGAEADPLFQPDSEIENILLQVRKEGKALPTIKDKAFAIARVPIVIIPAKGFLNVEALKQSGFKADTVGGYALLHNQLVLGINPNEMLKLNKGQREQGKEIPRAQWASGAERVKKLIEKQMKIKLTFVDEKPHGGQGGAWFWLMPEREAALLKNAFPGKSIHVKSWGFAF